MKQLGAQVFISLCFHKRDKPAVVFVSCLAWANARCHLFWMVSLAIAHVHQQKPCLEKLISVFFTIALCLRWYDAWPFLSRTRSHIFVTLCFL